MNIIANDMVESFTWFEKAHRNTSAFSMISWTIGVGNQDLDRMAPVSSSVLLRRGITMVVIDITENFPTMAEPLDPESRVVLNNRDEALIYTMAKRMWSIARVNGLDIDFRKDRTEIEMAILALEGWRKHQPAQMPSAATPIGVGASDSEAFNV